MASSMRTGRLITAGLALAVSAAVAGCATAPGGGAAQSLAGQSSQEQAYVQPLPGTPPGPDWKPIQVVLGFLAASASFELDPAAARAFLAPGVRWNPTGQVIVVGSQLSAEQVNNPKVEGPEVAEVSVHGQRLATLTSSGQYEYQPGKSAQYTFGLARLNGVYKIESLPQGGILVLTQPAFEQVFQPRNLYFLAQAAGSATYLVPDPVFAPVQSTKAANATTLASELVKGLFADDSWLSADAATTTAFPATTRLLRVTISGQSALVDLGGGAAHAKPEQLGLMYSQLVATLTSSSYAAPVADQVQMAINGKVKRPYVAESPRVPPVGSGSKPLYYIGAGQVSMLAAGSRKPAKVPAPAHLLGGLEATAAAVSPEPHPELAVAAPDGSGCAVSVGPAGKETGYRTYHLPGTGAGCTSLSWGGAGTVWAVADSQVWAVSPHGAPQQVSLPVTPLTPHGTQVLALRMAPDGVRVALLVRSGGRTRLLLAVAAYSSASSQAVFGDLVVPVGSDLANPTAMSWYSPDELIALDGNTLYEVPLTGSNSSQIVTVPPGTAVVVTDGSALAVRTTNGQVYIATRPLEEWVRATGVLAGSIPAYPG